MSCSACLDVAEGLRRAKADAIVEQVIRRILELAPELVERVLREREILEGIREVRAGGNVG